MSTEMLLRLAIILLLTTTAHGALYLSTAQFPDLSASYVMCQQYATDNSHTFSGVEEDSTRPAGCYLTGNEVKWNQFTSNNYPDYEFVTQCSASYQCIQSNTHGIIGGTMVEKASDTPSNSMSYLDCRRYASQTAGAVKTMQWATIEDYVIMGSTVDITGQARQYVGVDLAALNGWAPGCLLSSNGKFYYNMNMASTASCSSSNKCIDGDAYVEPEQPSCPDGRTERCIKNEYLN